MNNSTINENNLETIEGSFCFTFFNLGF